MFELMYAGGGYYGLEIQRGKVVTKFTEKGKAYTGASPADVGMSLEQFEDYLQRVVNDFMLHASQNGGWRRAGD
jgi:hypothetical protein